MNLDSLIPSTGEWLRGTGPESDVVVSTRIRLARNLAAFPFTNRASAHQRAEIEAMLQDRLAKVDPPLQYVSLVIAHTLPLENASCKILRRCGYERAGGMIDPEDGLVWRWQYPTGASCDANK